MSHAGLFVSSLAIHMSASAGRLMPEPLNFALNLLQTFCEQSESKATTARGWTLQLAPETGNMTAASVIPLTLDLGSESACSSPDFAASCVTAAVGLVGRAAEASVEMPSFPELFAPAVVLLKKLDSQPQSMPKVIRHFLLRIRDDLYAFFSPKGLILKGLYVPRKANVRPLQAQYKVHGMVNKSVV